jgi:hypothetical protein
MRARVGLFTCSLSLSLMVGCGSVHPSVRDSDGGRRRSTGKADASAADIASESRGDKRAVVDAKINGMPVRLVLDTGSPFNIVWADAAKRLGLQVDLASSKDKGYPDQARHGFTEKCSLTVGGAEVFQEERSFMVMEIPFDSHVWFDGVLAWNDIRDRVIKLELDENKVEFLEKVPEHLESWSKWDLNSEYVIAVTDLMDDAGERTRILFDTGSPDGVSLNGALRERFSRQNPGLPSTVKGSYLPAAGFFVEEQRWAREISIGSATIREVPVNFSSPGMYVAEDVQAVLGAFALTRLHVIIDGPNNKVYLSPNETFDARYTYNKIGAVFMPETVDTSALVAHVIDGSPAFEAGVRNGDVLLKLAEREATDWRLESSFRGFMNSIFRGDPKNRGVWLTLRRGSEVLRVKVKPRNLFPAEWTW